jgi:glycosyltransferase involved in cell wall biosynthesis
MRVVLIADAFPPMRTSGAVQMRDLAQEFAKKGHEVTVLVPMAGSSQPWILEKCDSYEVLRLRSPRAKDVGHVRRALAEVAMPFFMMRNFDRSPLANVYWDAVIWYSPSIFLGPLAAKLKKQSSCPSYLIVRDIFPEWAVDMGVMRRGLAYRFFKLVEYYQYTVADVIGIQTPSNAPYFSRLGDRVKAKVEVLQNWLAEAADQGCRVEVATTSMAGRFVFVYAGNMGVAQGMDVLIDTATLLKNRSDIGFLFVGRGSEAERLRQEAAKRGLDNVVFHDEIDPSEIPGLYAQCDAGLVALDPRHKTHNVPGKFLSYMQAGLPVLASVNNGNDLVQLIRGERVGEVSTEHTATGLAQLAVEMVEQRADDPEVKNRCCALSKKLFSSSAAVQQIARALDLKHKNVAPHAADVTMNELIQADDPLAKEGLILQSNQE